MKFFAYPQFQFKRFSSSILAAAGMISCFALPLALMAQKPVLTVQVDHPVAKVSPMLYGLMTEEINYSYDGGLYAELVHDRTPGSDWQALAHWTMVTRGNSAVDISVDDHTGPSAAIARSIKVAVKEASEAAPAGVQNDGYWGIAVRPHTTYTGSFYAKTDTAGMPVRVALVNDTTGVEEGSATVTGITGEWKQYGFTLKTNETPASATNHLVLTTTRPGTLWLDLVSLFPPTYHDRPFGNRVDLMEKMAAMHLHFLRMPGGNYLEGDHIAERFDWKKTIGPWTSRPTHRSPWNYRSSDGMGLLEFLEWCEDLKIEPVLAVYAGYSLAQEHVEPGEKLEPYVQDSLDEIEYVSGSVSTKWGAERAKNGHPAPFPLHYVEIGNEDFFDHSGSYEGRYAQFYREIKAKYPELQLIATMPIKKMKPDVLDDHFYMSAHQAFADAHHYDMTDRNGPKIFVGEWATREGDPTPNLQAALGDAAWMTGLERNSDLVVMASYAPLFVNVNPGAMQWSTDLIGYDALNSYGSPSYWAQVMFASYLGTEVVSSTLSDAWPQVYTSVTRDEANRKLFVKIVNATSDAQEMQIALKGVNGVKRTARLVTLSGNSPNATNSITDPDRVTPKESMIEIAEPTFRHSFVPYSINVLELSY